MIHCVYFNDRLVLVARSITQPIDGNRENKPFESLEETTAGKSKCMDKIELGRLARSTFNQLAERIEEAQDTMEAGTPISWIVCCLI